MELNKVVTKLEKSKIKAGDGKKDGNYPLFTCSSTVNKYYDEFLYDTEAIILSTGGNTVINYYNGKFAYSTDCLAIKTNNEIKEKYLYYYLISRINKIEKMFRGVGIKHLNKNEFFKLNIKFPQIKVQEIVVDELDNLQSIIDIRKKQIQEFDELIKSQFVEMFGDPFENKNNYKFITFDSFMEKCVDIGSNGANKTIVEHLDMKDTEDYALLVRTLNFTSNDFKNNVKYISKDAYEFFSKSKVFGGEIIFNKIGSAGINFLMPNLQRPVSLGLNQIMVTPKEINTRYLYDFLNTEFGKYQINSRVNGAVTKSIQKTELKKIPIMYPPMELQKKYSDFAEQIDKQKFEIQKSLEEMQELYESLMDKYFG